jgi:hypothetical protein
MAINLKKAPIIVSTDADQLCEMWETCRKYNHLIGMELNSYMPQQLRHYSEIREACKQLLLVTETIAHITIEEVTQEDMRRVEEWESIVFEMYDSYLEAQEVE